jgi:hypothetical protein
LGLFVASLSADLAGTPNPAKYRAISSSGACVSALALDTIAGTMAAMTNNFLRAPSRCTSAPPVKEELRRGRSMPAA